MLLNALYNRLAMELGGIAAFLKSVAEKYSFF
jgi:hypothetical protein